MNALSEIRAAEKRISPHLRRTPLLDVGPLPGGERGSRLILKLENLQVTGSFKARGATNKVLALTPREAARREGLTYVHPIADPEVIAGQGTVGLETLEDAPGTDLFLVAIGGGGLISGVATAVRWLWFEAGVAAELSGAAAVAALLGGKIRLDGVRSACAIVCGAGTDGLAG